jgi:hypothetical protein
LTALDTFVRNQSLSSSPSVSFSFYIYGAFASDIFATFKLLKAQLQGLKPKSNQAMQSTAPRRYVFVCRSWLEWFSRCRLRSPQPRLILFSVDLMCTRVLLTTFLLSIAVGASAEVTPAELVGQWHGGTSSRPVRYIFRADHSFDSSGGDTHTAGKWKLHHGNKLELITHYDYDSKPISRSSPREWMIIESIDKGRMRFRRYYKGFFDAGYRLSGPEVLTKGR